MTLSRTPAGIACAVIRAARMITSFVKINSSGMLFYVSKASSLLVHCSTRLPPLTEVFSKIISIFFTEAEGESMFATALIITEHSQLIFHIGFLVDLIADRVHPDDGPKACLHLQHMSPLLTLSLQKNVEKSFYHNYIITGTLAELSERLQDSLMTNNYIPLSYPKIFILGVEVISEGSEESGKSMLKMYFEEQRDGFINKQFYTRKR